ncbi:hypothetical protein L0244_20245 [bacterium]|nr:hypothetical protein [bacterium]
MFIPIYASAFTIIFKSGKRMEGTLLWDDGDTLRFKDRNGVLYSLKRSVLDLSAMREANPDSVPKPGEKVPEKKQEHTVMQSSLAEIAQRERQRRTGNARVFTNEDLDKMTSLAVIETRNGAPLITSIKALSLPDSSKALQKWIDEKNAEYNRLRASCRNAGGDPNSNKEFRTDSYNVDGKEVVVSGYWADPKEVERAQQICRKAMETKAALELAHKKLASLQKN